MPLFAALGTIVALGFSALPAAAHHDLYRHVSVGEINGNSGDASQFNGASADGSRVFFSSSEQLAAEDTDAESDIYERSGGVTRLVSTGAINGNGPFHVDFRSSSTSGAHVWFVTAEQLEASDTDSSIDIYQRSGGVTTLVSRGAINGNGAHDASFSGASTDGNSVFFATEEQLEAGDTDGSRDIYRRAGGVTTRISVGQVNGNGAFSPSLRRVTADGSRVFFETNEQLVPGDTDIKRDVYERSGNTTRQLSLGPAGGNGAEDASFNGASANGTRVFFTTNESLVAGDTDGQLDVYQRFGNTTSWLSRGTAGGNGAEDAFFAGSSADGRRVFFETAEPLVPGDADTETDVYFRRNGRTKLVSVGQINGNGAFFADFKGASSNGKTAFFETAEALVADDLDAEADVYQRSSGVTKLVSAGDINGNGANPAQFLKASSTGATVLFATFEQLTLGDTDAEFDVYERAGGVTTLVSIGDANLRAEFIGATPDCRWVYFVTEEKILADDRDSVHDVYAAYDP